MIQPIARLALPAAGLAIGLLSTAGSLQAQPAPTFRASCAELRSALKALKGKEGELITIEVEGPLTMVRVGEGLTYLGLCQAPAPRVLCVTYDTNGRKPGETVIVAGAWEQVGPDHVKLDPCLHHPPE